MLLLGASQSQLSIKHIFVLLLGLALIACASAPKELKIFPLQFQEIPAEVKTGEILSFDVALDIKGVGLSSKDQVQLKDAITKKIKIIAAEYSLRETVSSKRESIQTRLFQAISSYYSADDDALRHQADGHQIEVVQLEIRNVDLPVDIQEKVNRYMSLQEKIMGYQYRINHQSRYIKKLLSDNGAKESPEILKAKVYLGKLKLQRKTLVNEYNQLAEELQFKE